MITEKKLNFVYITTCLITNKQYVGDHSTNDLESIVTKNYFGSGTLIKKAILKYKKENFKKEILEFFSTKQEAFDAQEKYIIQYNTLTPNGYNLHIKGGGISSNHSDISKLKMSGSQKGNKNRFIPIDKNIIDKIVYLHTIELYSSNEISKIVNISAGRIKRLLKKLNLFISFGSDNRSPRWRKMISESKKGIPRSEETKLKIKFSTKGIKPWNTGTKKDPRISGKNHHSYIYFSDDEINNIINLFINKGLSPHQISKNINKDNISRARIVNILKEHNVYVVRTYPHKNPHSYLAVKKFTCARLFNSYNILIIENPEINLDILKFLGVSEITQNNVYIIKKDDIINFKILKNIPSNTNLIYIFGENINIINGVKHKHIKNLNNKSLEEIYNSLINNK